MPKLPWVRWFPQDWAADPALAQCDISTRGVWIDMVNAMLLSGKPFVQGTDEQLARLCRCRPMQIQAAICELRDFGVADLCECKTDANAMQNPCKKITCRRLVRDMGISELRSKASSSRWCKRDAKVMQTPASAYASASASVQDRGTGGRGETPTLEEVKLACAKSGVSETDAEWFWNHCEGNGWTNNGKPMKNWLRTVISWKLNGYLPSQKGLNGTSKRTRENPRNAGIAGDISEQSKAIAAHVARQQAQHEAARLALAAKMAGNGGDTPGDSDPGF